MDHARRIGQLRRRMTKAGLTGLLVTHLPDVRYLAGFTGSSAALAITRRAARLFTDGRYTAQAAEEVRGAQVEIVSGPPAVAAVQWLAAQPGAGIRGVRSRTHTRWPSTPVSALSYLPSFAALSSPPRRSADRAAPPHQGRGRNEAHYG